MITRAKVVELIRSLDAGEEIEADQVLEAAAEARAEAPGLAPAEVRKLAEALDTLVQKLGTLQSARRDTLRQLNRGKRGLRGFGAVRSSTRGQRCHKSV